MVAPLWVWACNFRYFSEVNRYYIEIVLTSLAYFVRGSKLADPLGVFLQEFPPRGVSSPPSQGRCSQKHIDQSKAVPGRRGSTCTGDSVEPFQRRVRDIEVIAQVMVVAERWEMEVGLGGACWYILGIFQDMVPG